MSDARKVERPTPESDRATEKQTCPTRTVDDSPSTQDVFAQDGRIGSHQRVADAISEVILSPQESGGKMIGLEGGWGSGKTTVVNLLRKNLKGVKDLTVFTFDAWAHQGDPLRRTYLESLIRHFKAEGWVDVREWTKVQEKLAKRRRVTTTRTIPKSTTFGKILALSALLVPVGIPYLSKSLEKGVTIDPGLPVSWPFVIGLALTCAPILVLLGNAIRVGARRLLGVPASSDGLTDWSFIMGSASTESTQDTLESPDPTSIEFEEEFRNLMGAALSKQRRRTAVIVLDNLDRVDPKDALSMWATLQTFLQYRNLNPDEWAARVWIVVPYDPVGLSRLWDRTRAARVAPSPSAPTAGATRPDAEAEESHDEVAASFIDKSFQLRFEVPLPVLSNWKTYLNKLLSVALPEHKEGTKNSIYQVIKSYRENLSDAPSPRELIIFVNSIGIVHRQWQDAFPLDHVAYYVLLKRDRINVLEGLMRRQIPSENIRPILSPDAEASLAGLAYNVEAALGQQFLLEDPIHEALTARNYDSFQALFKSPPAGFLAVLEQVVLRRLKVSEPIAISNAAYILDQVGLLKSLDTPEKRSIHEALSKGVRRIEKWLPFDERNATGIAAACRMLNERSVAEAVVTSMRTTLNSIRTKPEEPVDFARVVANALLICEDIARMGHKDLVAGSLALPADAREWPDVCSAIEKHPEAWWYLFVPSTDFEAISGYLSNTVSGGALSYNHFAAIHVTQRTPLKPDWQPLSSAIEKRLSVLTPPIDAKEVDILLSCLHVLRQYAKDKIDGVLRRLTDSGILLHHLHQANAQGNELCKLHLVSDYLEQRPDLSKPTAAGNSEAGYAILLQHFGAADGPFASALIEIFEAQGRLRLLLRVVEARGKYDPLVLTCLRKLADTDAPDQLFTAEFVISHWAELQTQLDEQEGSGRFKRLVEYMAAKSQLVETLLSQGTAFDSRSASFYVHILAANKQAAFVEWCSDGMRRLPSPVWKDELSKEGPLVDLLVALRDAGVVLDLQPPYQDAIVEHAAAVLSGSVKPSPKLVSNAPKLLSAVSNTDAREALRLHLIDAATEREGDCADAFFEMYGDDINDPKSLLNNTRVVDRLFSGLVKKSAIGGLRWLRKVFADDKELLTRFRSKALVEDFKSRVSMEIEKPITSNEEAHKLIVEIGAILEIGSRNGGRAVVQKES